MEEGPMEEKESEEIMVEYYRQGQDGHLLALGSPAIPDMHIDYTGIPQDQRAGTANRLLCASALYCFASTLGSALIARGATIKSLKGRAVSQKEKDDYYRTKVSRIRIEIDVNVEEKDLPILEKCQKIMERGCLITYSLDGGIEIEHSIKRAEGN